MLVQSLSLKLAGELGGIGQFEIERAPGRAAGNVCVLKAGIPSISQGETSIRAAQRCLRRTVDWDRPGAEVLATLARTQLALDPSDTDGPLGLANQAVAMAPLSARANTALMVAQFLSGRPEAAIEAGRRAQALNPGSPKVAAKLATVMFAAGLVEEGVALAGEARAPSNRRRGKQRWFLRSTHIARMVDGLPPCRTGEFGDLLVRALRAASLAQLGSPQAPAGLADLRRFHPGFEQTFSRKIRERRFKTDVADALEAGLRKAGAGSLPSWRTPVRSWIASRSAAVCSSLSILSTVQANSCPRPRHSSARQCFDAAKADMAGRGAFRLGMSGGRAVTPAIVRRAKMRTALQDPAADANFRLPRIVARLRIAAARVARDAAGMSCELGVTRRPVVCRPLPYVADHVIEAVAVCRERPDGAGAFGTLKLRRSHGNPLPDACHRHGLGLQLVTPGIFCVVQSTTSRQQDHTGSIKSRTQQDALRTIRERVRLRTAGSER